MTELTSIAGGWGAEMLARWSCSLGRMRDQVYSTALWHCIVLAESADLEGDVVQQLSCVNWGLVVGLCNEFRYDLEALIEKVRPVLQGLPLSMVRSSPHVTDTQELAP